MVNEFENAKSKLEESQCLLREMKQASEAITFRTKFQAFLNSARAITAALQKQGKHIDGFDRWYQSKQIEMKEDPLLRFIHEARTEDFHEGKHRLLFSTRIEPFSATSFGPPPLPNAKAIIRRDGPFWLIDEGTPQERRIPTVLQGKTTINVELQNPPQAHLGNKVDGLGPVQLSELSTQYYAGLVHEAIQKFSK